MRDLCLYLIFDIKYKSIKIAIIHAYLVCSTAKIINIFIKK